MIAMTDPVLAFPGAAQSWAVAGSGGRSEEE